MTPSCPTAHVSYMRRANLPTLLPASRHAHQHAAVAALPLVSPPTHYHAHYPWITTPAGGRAREPERVGRVVIRCLRDVVVLCFAATKLVAGVPRVQPISPEMPHVRNEE